MNGGRSGHGPRHPRFRNGRPDADPPPMPAPNSRPARTEPRDFVGVRTHCCGQYVRVYRTDGRLFVGRCPRCGRFVRVSGGTRVPPSA